MFNTQTIRSSNRMTGVLLNQKSRVQKKYFSLMLVPSYSTGKTRSVRIPQRAFYIALAVVFVISATILAVYLRSNHFMRVAEEINTSRVQLLEEFNELQQESANLQNKYVDDSNHLKSQLTDEQNRFQTEKNRQRQDYQSTLDGLQEQVDDLERQLRDLDAARQAIVDQLSAKGYIPPVQSILTEMSDSQAVLLSARGDVQIRSDERFTSVKTTEEDLRDYFLLLTAKLEAETQCFAELQAYAQEISPYAKNYPTSRPVYGQVSSYFGYRANPMGGSGSEYHEGIDIRCKTGTSVAATGGGTVSEAGWKGSYGYVVVINHGFGIKTLYAHNSKLLVSVGDRVERGDTVAKSGSTGRSTGPHVHYEVQVNGATVNPAQYFLE